MVMAAAAADFASQTQTSRRARQWDNWRAIVPKCPWLGGYENICAAADILKGKDSGNGKFLLDIYPASMPVYKALMENGAFSALVDAGAIVKTAFCGPCFGAGDTPANGALSIRHSTRNFPNREGSKIQNGQLASVALMDARSIAATAANKGFLTAATEVDTEFSGKKYFFDKTIYEKRFS